MTLTLPGRRLSTGIVERFFGCRHGGFALSPARERAGTHAFKVGELKVMKLGKIGLLGLLVCFTGCGGGTQPSSMPESPGSTAEPVAEAPAGDAPSSTVGWEGMNREQRMQYMQETVLPNAKALFVEVAPEKYADFNCKTCHGDNAQEVDFQMPNQLPPLPTTDTINAAMAANEPVATFMLEKVTPGMAQMLGREMVSESNPDGFSCFGCHQKGS
jgi:hypothetical protein